MSPAPGLRLSVRVDAQLKVALFAPTHLTVCSMQPMCEFFISLVRRAMITA